MSEAVTEILAFKKYNLKLFTMTLKSVFYVN